jgi:hypothetical protein
MIGSLERMLKALEGINMVLSEKAIPDEVF